MKVLLSVRDRGDRTNPYIRQTVSSLPSSHQVDFFTWRRGFGFDYDVFHVHWPESIIGNRRFLQNFANQIIGPLLLLWLHYRRVHIVRTVHNSEPHEELNRWQSFLLKKLEDRTSVQICLTKPESPPATDGRLYVHIPHGHYKDWFSRYDLPASRPGRFLYFGLIRSYKNVPQLIRAFGALPKLGEYTLHIAGSPENDRIGNEIRLAMRSMRNVSANLTYLPEESLAECIGEAELIVLPYTYLENSGAVLLAMSLGRPVLVPRTTATLQLQAEFGSDWIHLYSGMLTSEELEGALMRVRSLSLEKAPDLSSRDWVQLGRVLATVYDGDYER